MIDFADARRKMIDSQVRTEDVTDYDLLAALGAVQRERFVPDRLQALAYLDEDLLVSERGAPPRYLMRPATFARLVQLAEIQRSEKVLDVGATGGYSTAVLAHLAASVVGVESDPLLAAAASRSLAELGARVSAAVHAGPLAEGYAAGGPYDVIVVEGAADVIPDALVAQLADGGRLVAIIGQGLAARATLFARTRAEFGARPVFSVSAMPLDGFRKINAFVF